MSQFLIIYNRKTGQVTVEQFPDAISAMRARLLQESIVSADTEVAVLDSESEAELRQTHSRYFMSPTEILENSRQLLDKTTPAS